MYFVYFYQNWILLRSAGWVAWKWSWRERTKFTPRQWSHRHSAHTYVHFYIQTRVCGNKSSSWNDREPGTEDCIRCLYMCTHVHINVYTCMLARFGLSLLFLGLRKCKWSRHDKWRPGLFIRSSVALRLGFSLTFDPRRNLYSSFYPQCEKHTHTFVCTMYVDRHAANKWESNTVIGHFQERLAKKTGEKIQTYLSIYVYEICMYFIRTGSLFPIRLTFREYGVRLIFR